LNDVLELLIALRKEARAEKNYKLADDIRNRLGEIGIILEDAPTGTVWKRK
ncbi:MAG: cysteine--tRNA ligase, partial [Clostridiales bacterium]